VKNRLKIVHVCLLAICFLLSIFLAEALSTPPDFIRIIGSQGTGDGQLNYPLDVAIGTNGNVYVLDSGNNRIQVFSPTGEYISKFGEGLLWAPHGIAIDKSGYVYVADTFNHVIRKFAANGTYASAWGTNGSDDGQFDYPMDVVVDSSGNICVLDNVNVRVQEFTPNGLFIAKWAIRPNTYGRAMALDTYGNFYIAEVDTVSKFNPSGTLLSTWGGEGSSDGEFNGAYGIAVDVLGTVYVSDYGNFRIETFTSDGLFIEKWGTGGDGNGQFNGPVGMVAHSSGNLFVVDRGSHRVQVFGPIPENKPPIAKAGKDQVFYSEANLDGSLSWDPDGNIVSWEWSLKHRENSAFDRTATGQNPTVNSLAPGFYDVLLRVTDDKGDIATDEMLLAVAGGTWDINGDGKQGLEEIIFILQVLSGARNSQ
jgi:DNA-binding beta-propeller fold protein YncE